jgi:hypothetical protein
MNSDDNATAGAIRSLLVNMPIPARDAILADARLRADPEAWAEIHDIIMAEMINGTWPEAEAEPEARAEAELEL